MSQEEIDRYNAQRAAERGACYFKKDEGITTHQLVQVLAVGTPVKMHDIQGIVTGVWVQGPDHRSVKYQVAYWKDGTRSEGWLNDFEVTVAEDLRDEVSIGFITRGT